jgi:uncharacterized membrane protein YgdD (TMEM256/DUF423 family)
MSPFWTIGTLLGASSVALGAFGAHGLKQRIRDPALIASWGTAAQYQVHLFSPLIRVAPLLTPHPSSLQSMILTNDFNSSFTPLS